MNKLIQTLVLTAIVFSPLSFLSLIASADAHHTSSHVSTLSMQTSIAKKKKKNKVKVRTGKKRMTTSSSTKKKPASVDAATPPETGMPAGADSPMKQTKPDTTMPNSKVKPIDPSVDSGITKPAPDLKVPTGLPSVPTSIPSGVSTPSGLPSIPSGLPSVKPSIPTLPTGLPK